MSKIVNSDNLLQFGQEFLENLDERYLVESILWADLKTLRDTNKLVKGKKYRITDYVATTIDPETRSANHPFDIIVTAIDESNLSEECSAALHSGDTYFSNSNLSAWKIWYTIDNDTSTFDWADSTNGKGVIYRMIDEFGNDLGYDFKGILMARYRVTPATGYTDALSSISGMWLGRNHTSILMGLNVDTSAVKWYYTFSSLASDWDNPEDATVTHGESCFGNIIPPASMRANLRYINNNVFFNGQYPYDTLKALDSTSMAVLYSANFVAKADCSRNTFFSGAVHTSTDSQFRDNVIFGPFRHNVIGTDVEKNTIVAPHDIAACQMNIYNNVIKCSRFTAIRTDQTFHDNKFVIGDEFTGCTFNGFSTNNTVVCDGNIMYCTAEYFANNNLTVSGNITNNSFGPNFKANTATITGGISNVTFRKQVNNNTFLSDLVGCDFDGMVSYVTIPAVSGKRFGHCDVRGGVRGTSSALISLDNSAFYVSAVTGVTRRVVIQGSSDGKIVATWKGTDGVEEGVYKLPSANTWTALPSIATMTQAEVINTINTIFS